MVVLNVYMYASSRIYSLVYTCTCVCIPPSLPLPPSLPPSLHLLQLCNAVLLLSLHVYALPLHLPLCILTLSATSIQLE